MRTLVLEPGIEPKYERALAASARKAGWEVALVQHIPHTTLFLSSDEEGRPGKNVDESLLRNPDCWFHGSIQASKSAQKGTSWAVHAPWYALRCSAYYPKLRARLFQQRHEFTTVAGVLADKDRLFASDLVVDETLFFRPDGSDKLFTGGCISLPDFDAGYRLMTFYDPPPEAPVVVAQPKQVLAEARFLVVGGEVVAGSYYKIGTQGLKLRADTDLMAIAREFLAFCKAQGYDPAPSWVLDLGQDAEGWWIMEVGATSCCGFYKCDLDAFVESLDQVL